MKKTEKRLSFNEWAIKFNVSTRWEADTLEKRSFIERLNNARFQQYMDQQSKKYENVRNF